MTISFILLLFLKDKQNFLSVCRCNDYVNKTLFLLAINTLPEEMRTLTDFVTNTMLTIKKMTFIHFKQQILGGECVDVYVYMC